MSLKYTKSMSLKYEPASEALHISVKYLPSGVVSIAVEVREVHLVVVVLHVRVPS